MTSRKQVWLSFPMIFAILLAICMFRLSYWQYERHLQKKKYITALEANLSHPIEEIEDLPTDSPEYYAHRRVRVSGRYDFKNEIVLRNRRNSSTPGVHILTPLKLDSDGSYILVKRGFIPLKLSSKEKREQFQRKRETTTTVLLKKSVPRRVFAPKDPESGSDNPWVDAWLRVDLPNIEKQLPYKLYPLYGEIIPAGIGDNIKEQIISDGGGKEELLTLTAKPIPIEGESDIELSKYPIPTFDTTVSPGRHLGYVFEWAFMGIATLLIGYLLARRRAKFLYGSAKTKQSL